MREQNIGSMDKRRRQACISNGAEMARRQGRKADSEIIEKRWGERDKIWGKMERAKYGETENHVMGMSLAQYCSSTEKEEDESSHPLCPHS